MQVINKLYKGRIKYDNIPGFYDYIEYLKVEKGVENLIGCYLRITLKSGERYYPEYEEEYDLPV